MKLKMTPAVIIFGGIFILAVIVFAVVYWPWVTKVEQPSEIFRMRSAEENEGRKIYIASLLAMGNQG
jgi:membrane protein implicated in regulation of membrane protease activity